MNSPHTFTAGFLFCGLGAGALGFIEAFSSLGGHGAKFQSVGGIDNDPASCADFEYLTKSPATLADLSKMTPEELRAHWGDVAPDAIFLSPPCKGFSGLLSKTASEAPKYQALNRLVLQGLFLACETWATPPSLLVIENVPRIQTRGADLLRQVRSLLSGYGYVFSEATHDCGEVGGLAQHRRRFLLVARLKKSVPCFIYQPPKKRVRGCGEVLGALPLPEDESAGELHKLPKLSWLNWVRLALIPAGGDWRDLPKQEAASLDKTAKNADSFAGRPGLFGVLDWQKPAPTVTGSARVSSSNAPGAVADPRPYGFKCNYGVAQWEEPLGTVTGAAKASSGTFSVADPRAAALNCTPRNGSYGVMSWQEAAGTITGAASIDNGSFAVADPRKAPEQIAVIISADGTWHRPLTTLELAALQGLPALVDGKPLALAGKSTAKHRERVGNAVPVGAAKAIGESLLTALLAAKLGTWTLGSTGIWVEKRAIKKTIKRAQRTVTTCNTKEATQ
jgi:site-specific DNA-cytosine methylase